MIWDLPIELYTCETINNFSASILWPPWRSPSDLHCTSWLFYAEVWVFLHQRESLKLKTPYGCQQSNLVENFHGDAMSGRQPWSSPFSIPSRTYVRRSREATDLFVHKPLRTSLCACLWNSSGIHDLPTVGRLDLRRHSHPGGSIAASDEARANMDHSSPSNSLLPFCTRNSRSMSTNRRRWFVSGGLLQERGNRM